LLARLLWNFQFAMRSFYFKRDRIEELRQKKLSRLLEFAYEFVPYYRGLFKRNGVLPDDIREVRQLRLLPTLSKADIIRNYPNGLMSRMGGGAVIRRGSGTTGTTASVAHSPASIDARHALSLRSRVLCGLRPWHRVVTLWIPVAYWRRIPDSSGRPRPVTSMYQWPVWFLGRPLPGIRVLRSIPGDPWAEARALHNLKPDFVFGRPTHLRRIGRALEELGLEMALKGIFTTGEVRTPTCTKELERRFNSKVFDAMGTSETGGVACTCQRKKYHMYDDFMVLEVLRDGEQVGPGETGELVVTDLHNYLMPLIRYRTGDYVRLGRGSGCECGSELTLMESVEGRSNDCLINTAGLRVWPMEVAEHVESKFSLRDFQIEQVSMNEVVVKLMPGDVQKTDSLPALKSYLETVIGNPISLRFEERSEDSIWRKYRPVATQLT
jgi:phenylacetate-coenzyme A ligase PaaK-like adenylate-forming protein